MNPLPQPQVSATVAINACLAGMTIEGRIAALRDAIPSIANAETAYILAGPNGSLHEIRGAEAVTPELDTAAMKQIYSSHFMRAGSPSRYIYDSIKLACLDDICPLCGQRLVEQVDHYLPQDKHPSLILVPANLIPSCETCNKKKLAHMPSCPEELTFHPYFDNLHSFNWLAARIYPSAPPGIGYRVETPEDLPVLLRDRITNHFRMMGLARLYTQQASRELANIAGMLLKVGARDGSTGVREYLAEELQSRADVDINSWQTALYKALSESDWFCNEGYRSIRTPDA